MIFLLFLLLCLSGMVYLIYWDREEELRIHREICDNIRKRGCKQIRDLTNDNRRQRKADTSN